nr:hypothetical protein OH837_38440 [Streptomyces canus]
MEHELLEYALYVLGATHDLRARPLIEPFLHPDPQVRRCPARSSRDHRAGRPHPQLLTIAQRDDKEKLERKVEPLKRQRPKLGRQLDDLPAQFAEIDADRVALVKEEGELNDQRAMLNFDWARYEEFLWQRADAEVIRLRDELARTSTDPDSKG